MRKRLIKQGENLIIRFDKPDIKRYGLIEGEIMDLPLILEEGKKEDFETISCDFCGKETDGKLVLKDLNIQKKDGSDIHLCSDCSNNYSSGDYDKIKIKEKNES